MKMPVTKACPGYEPFSQEYNITAEYNLLRSVKTPGIYVIPAAISSRIWNGVLFIRHGIYQDGVFRFTLTIPDNFPDTDCDIPTVVFEFPVFHPEVDPSTGLVDIKQAFPKWRRNVNHIWQVLLYIRRIFHKIDTKAALNKAAGDLYESDREAFKKRVSESVAEANERIYQPPALDDIYAMRFSKLNPDVHENTRDEMLQYKQGDPNSSSPGLTWVELETPHILTREDPATA